MKTKSTSKQLALIIYTARLSAATTTFGAQAVSAIVLNFIRSYKTLIFLYLILFIQVLLLVFKPAPQSEPSKISSEKNFQQKVDHNLDLSSVQTYKLKAGPNTINKELVKYQQDLKQIGNHRDVLINLALLNLALKNEEKFQRFLESTREMDPNWRGLSTN